MKTLGMLHPTDVFPSQPSTDSIGTMVAAASSGQAFDTPTGSGFVAFAANGIDFWVAWGSTAASIPTTSSTAGSTTNFSELNPIGRNYGSTASCTGFSIISASTGYIQMSFYRP